MLPGYETSYYNRMNAHFHHVTNAGPAYLVTGDGTTDIMLTGGWCLGS